MNIRKMLLAGALSLGLIGSIAAPATLAADSVPVEVTVGSGGGFFVVICNALATAQAGNIVPETNVVLGNVINPSASTAGSASGSLYVCYDDDLLYRAEGFRTRLTANDFVHSVDSNKKIGKANLRITGTSGVAQVQSTLSTGGTPKIGDIGTYVDQLVPVSQPSPTTIVPWTTSNVFSSAINVHYGYNGVGTIMSGGQVDLELTIPAGTFPGTYNSEITATVITDPSIFH